MSEAMARRADIAAMTLRPRTRPGVTVTRVDTDALAGRWHAPCDAADDVCLHLHRARTAGYQMRDDQREMRHAAIEPGTLVHFDPARDPAIRFAHASDIVVVRIGATTLDRDAIARRGVASGQPFADPRAAALIALLADAETGPPAHPLFVEQIALALAMHLRADEDGETPRGGLAPWQARRARMLMEARLGGGVDLLWIARECGLSLSHFSRAFRVTLGDSPHAWLTARRVAKAKAMICETGATLVETAIACGFADQSHFSRAFKRHAGVSPGAWRRSHAIAP